MDAKRRRMDESSPATTNGDVHCESCMVKDMLIETLTNENLKLENRIKKLQLANGFRNHLDTWNDLKEATSEDNTALRCNHCYVCESIVSRLKTQNESVKKENENLRRRLAELQNLIDSVKRSVNVEDNGSRAAAEEIACTYDSTRIIWVKAENSSNISNLEQLSKVALLNICSYLNEKHLLTLRLVSKNLKMVANAALENRRKELVITSDHKKYEKVMFLLNLFRRSKTLNLQRPSLPAQSILKMCKDKLTSLQCMKLSTTHTDGIVATLSDYFSYLKSLILLNYRANDQQLASLLRNLPQLVHFEVHNSKINGDCFADLGDNVKTIAWTMHSDIGLSSDLSFSALGENITNFAFATNSRTKYLTSGQLILNIVTNDMPNLVSLRFNVTTSLNVEEAAFYKLTKLEELSIRCLRIDGDPNSIPEINSIRQLAIGCEKPNANYESFISKFADVEHFTLYLTDSTLITKTMISSFSKWISLRTFVFIDHTYKEPKTSFQTLQSIMSIVTHLDSLVLSLQIRLNEDDSEWISFVEQLKAIVESKNLSVTVIMYTTNEPYQVTHRFQ